MNTPLSNFQHFRRAQNRNTIPDRRKTHWNSAHRLWRCALELKTENLQTPFTLHWRCCIAEKFTLLFVRLWVAWFRRQFVSKLEFSLCLYFIKVIELFSNLQAPARVSTVCARYFSAFCACQNWVTSGIVLLDSIKSKHKIKVKKFRLKMSNLTWS